ncbi:condensation domain-containing protein [Nocardiopsis baichengensis]|uniref:condensation domain-containing protein n=1 Tax=Nocardiopsis baichengensis TaxID=280240 RepID=UPI001EF9CF90|nr:condensation domain-containing protein [Nocardiopsis baichengensis]
MLDPGNARESQTDHVVLPAGQADLLIDTREFEEPVRIPCQQREFATVALAVYNVILAIESGQSDVTVGVPMANRRRRPSDGCMGFLANTQAVRVVIDPERSLRELVIATARALRDAQSHQEMPLAFVLQDVIGREMQGFPETLFRNLFIFHSLHPLAPLFSSVSVEQRPNPSTGEAMAEMALQVLRTPGGALCHFQWDTETFNGDDGQRVADLYERACRRLASSADSTIAVVREA